MRLQFYLSLLIGLSGASYTEKIAAAGAPQMPEAFKQALALVRAGKLLEAEQPINRLLNETNDSGLSTAELLTARAFLRAENGRFKLAADDLQQVIGIDPSEHESWFFLTPLLIQTGQMEDYRDHCRGMLLHFAETTNGAVAERTAKCCLLMPSAVSPSDLDSAAKVAQKAVALAKKDQLIPWRRMTLALAEYRQGKFAGALKTIELAQKEVTQTRYAGHDECHADTWFIAAMAHYQLKHSDEARAAFAHGRVIVQTRLPSLTNHDLSFGWVDVLMTYILMREAEMTITPKPAVPAK
jgi:tetratricopeptide (TPR) repeat protein